MAVDPERNNLLAQIKEGMSVVDTNGDELGKVEFVKMSDPNEPAEVAGTDDPGGGLFNFARDDDADGVPDILEVEDEPETVESRRRRRGFVRVDTSGFFSRDTLVDPGYIASVDGDTVRLSVTKDSLKG